MSKKEVVMAEKRGPSRRRVKRAIHCQSKSLSACKALLYMQGKKRKGSA